MSASFHNSQQLQQEITKLGNFMNCQNFSPEIQKFPGIPAGNFWSGGFPGIPGNSRTGIPGNSRTGIPGGLAICRRISETVRDTTKVTLAFKITNANTLLSASSVVSLFASFWLNLWEGNNFARSCLHHESNIVRCVAWYSVLHGRYRSPTGRTVSFCLRRYNCDFNDLLSYVAHLVILLVISARQHAERAICYRPSVRLSVRLSVCLSVCPSVCHTGGSVKNGWTYHRNSFTIW